MKITIRPSVVLAFRSPLVRETIFLVFSVVRAAVISGFIYVAFGTSSLWRWRLFGSAIRLLAQALQVPIFLFSHSVGLLIPYLASPFHFGWIVGGPGFDGILDPRPWLPHHLRAGIITYTLLFHIPAAFRWLRAHFGAADGPAAT
jgi:hypothetical protein